MVTMKLETKIESYICVCEREIVRMHIRIWMYGIGIWFVYLTLLACNTRKDFGACDISWSHFDPKENWQ